MIDWNAETWGNRVHLSATGSWVPDRHSSTAAAVSADALED